MTLHSHSVPVVPKASRQGPSKSTQLLINQSHNSRVSAECVCVWGGQPQRALADPDMMDFLHPLLLLSIHQKSFGRLTFLSSVDLRSDCGIIGTF